MYHKTLLPLSPRRNLIISAGAIFRFKCLLSFFIQRWTGKKEHWCISADDKLLQPKKKNLLMIFREMSAWRSDERLDQREL